MVYQSGNPQYLTYLRLYPTRVGDLYSAMQSGDVAMLGDCWNVISRGKNGALYSSILSSQKKTLIETLQPKAGFVQ